VQKHLVALKSFYRWATDAGFVGENATIGVKIGRLKNKVVRGLSSEEVKLLLSKLSSGDSMIERRNRAIVYILVDCGLRVSELVNLRVSDVDMRSGVIRVMGKGSKERLARMGLNTQKALWEYMAFRNSSIEWLWVNDINQKLDRTGVQQWLRKFGRRVGLRLYPHLLRHTFAINFLRNGANVFECQYALGHSSLEMTRRYCQALGFDDVFKRHETASPIDNALKR
jgi:integrase/recombinase XerD